jgi:hypothetical protein
MTFDPKAEATRIYAGYERIAAINMALPRNWYTLGGGTLRKRKVSELDFGNLPKRDKPSELYCDFIVDSVSFSVSVIVRGANTHATGPHDVTTRKDRRPAQQRYVERAEKVLPGLINEAKRSLKARDEARAMSKQWETEDSGIVPPKGA